METLNWVDYIIVFIFAFSVISGFSRGFIREMISLLVVVAAFVAATIYAHPLAQSFTSSDVVQNVVSTANSATGVNASQPVSYLAVGISFGLVFAGVYIVGAVIGFIVNLIFSFGVIGLLNRMLGAVFGLARGFIITIVVIFMVQLTAANEQPWWKKSTLVPQFEPYVAELGTYVAPGLESIKQKAGASMQNISNTVQSITK